MHPRLAFLILPYAVAELPGWSHRRNVVLRPRAAPSPEFSDWLWK